MVTLTDSKWNLVKLSLLKEKTMGVSLKQEQKSLIHLQSI